MRLHCNIGFTAAATYALRATSIMVPRYSTSHDRGMNAACALTQCFNRLRCQLQHHMHKYEFTPAHADISVTLPYTYIDHLNAHSKSTTLFHHDCSHRWVAAAHLRSHASAVPTRDRSAGTRIKRYHASAGGRSHIIAAAAHRRARTANDPGCLRSLGPGNGNVAVCETGDGTHSSSGVLRVRAGDASSCTVQSTPYT
jgi:hypothetical protein